MASAATARSLPRETAAVLALQQLSKPPNALAACLTFPTQVVDHGNPSRPVVMFSPTQGPAGRAGSMDLGKTLHTILEVLSVEPSQHSKVAPIPRVPFTTIIRTPTRSLPRRPARRPRLPPDAPTQQPATQPHPDHD